VKPSNLSILRCPTSGGPLVLNGGPDESGRVKSGELLTADRKYRYKVTDYIPRFVEPHNYADNFGFQWNKFARTQLDSHSGVNISQERFFRTTGWTNEVLRGKRVLDAGCGSGRFAEVAIKAGAQVFAVDYSSAVDACRRNFASSSQLEVIQGDIYHLPFASGTFDLVYCLGVLQHTPDVKGAFLALGKLVKPGGLLAVDIYPKLAKNWLWPKYWLRPFTRLIRKQTLFNAIQSFVPLLFPLSNTARRIPVIGNQLRHFVPIANYTGVFPLSSEQQLEWAVLDTFDMYSARYDKPQSAAELRSWFHRGGFDSIEVQRSGFLIGRGRKCE
jgi:2-polyprenyl-3-methyl-5-hydroxy-6-metoxy-1,4-benzoquinol methylase/uncharacterized protein YbaR (Trm112 family)